MLVGAERLGSHDELRGGGRQQCRHEEAGFAGCLGDEGDTGERGAVAGPEEGGDADRRVKARVGGVGEAFEDRADDRALCDERDEQSAHPASGDAEKGGGAGNTNNPHNTLTARFGSAAHSIAS